MVVLWEKVIFQLSGIYCRLSKAFLLSTCNLTATVFGAPGVQKDVLDRISLSGIDPLRPRRKNLLWGLYDLKNIMIFTIRTSRNPYDKDLIEAAYTYVYMYTCMYMYLYVYVAPAAPFDEAPPSRQGRVEVARVPGTLHFQAWTRIRRAWGREGTEAFGVPKM